MMPLRIVVADRDRSTIGVLSGFFAPALVEFAPADSAADLKKAIKAQTPSLIILAPLLHDMPNWQAAEKIVTAIKNSKKYNSIPVILLDGDPGGPDSARLRSLGADAYLNKPLERHDTVSTIESFFESLQVSPLEEDEDDIVIDFGDDEDDHSDVSVTTEGDSTLSEEILAMPYSAGEQSATHDIPVSEDERELDLERQSDGADDLRLAPAGTGETHEFIDSLEPSLLDHDMRGQDRSTDIHEIKPDSEQGLLEFFEPEDEPPSKSELQFKQELNKSDPGRVLQEAPSLEPLFGDFGHPSHHDDLGEIRSELTRVLPEKSEVLEQVRLAISEAFPTRSEVLQRLDLHLAAMIPLKKDMLAAVVSKKPDIGNASQDELTLSDLHLSKRPKGKSSEIGVGESSLRYHGQPSSSGGPEEADSGLVNEPLTIDAMVKSILREKIEEMLPEPNEILSWVRDEIDRLVLDTAEKIIRQKVEEITSDSAR